MNEKVQMVECLNHQCSKKFLFRRGKSFCSHVCQTRDNARKRYLRLRDTPEYKAQARVKFDKWRKENREHFNRLMRGYNLAYQAKKRKEARAKGYCIYCFKVPKEEDYVSCMSCRTRRKGYERRETNNEKD